MPQLAQEDDQETLARSGPMNRWIRADHLQPAVAVPGEPGAAGQSVFGSGLDVFGSEAISGHRRVALLLWPLDILSSDSREQLSRGATTAEWLNTFYGAQPATESLQDWLRSVLHHAHSATPALQGRITGPVRLIEQLSRAWRLTSEELAQLLDYPSARMAEDLLQGRMTFSGPADRADRARFLYLIHNTLAGLFPAPADEARWVRTPIDVLRDQSPLSHMIQNRIPGILAVRQLVEQRLANW